jgi:hypothetical protein
MKEDEFISKLENVDLSDIVLPTHQRLLRRALINSGYFKERNIMRLIKKASPVGGSVAAVAIIVAVIFSLKGTTPVSAQQVAQMTYRAVSRLPQEQQATLNANLGLSDNQRLDELLRKAQSAKDLKLVTAEEFSRKYGPPPGTNALNATFLKFSSEGVTYFLGINKSSGLPTVALAMVLGHAAGTAPGANSDNDAKSVSVRAATGAVTTAKLPPGVDPQHAQVQMQDGKIYINGQEVQQ